MRLLTVLFLLICGLGFAQNPHVIACPAQGKRVIEKANRISETPQKMSLNSPSSDSIQLQEKNKLAVSFPECNVMYAGYGNLMNLSLKRRKLRKATLECDGCDTLYRQKGDNPAWVIRANKTNKLTLRAVNKKGKTISTVEIPVFELPFPKVFLDSLSAQTTLSSPPNKIRLKLSENIPVSASFAVKSWEIIVNNREQFSGIGNKLSDALRAYMKSQHTGTISITINYFGPDSPQAKTIKEIFEFNLSI